MKLKKLLYGSNWGLLMAFLVGGASAGLIKNALSSWKADILLEMESERIAVVKSALEKELMPALEAQITSATQRPAHCKFEDPLFVELIEGKQYKAIVLCNDGQMLLSNVVNITRFGADDQIYSDTEGFRPAEAKPGR